MPSLKIQAWRVGAEVLLLVVGEKSCPGDVLFWTLPWPLRFSQLLISSIKSSHQEIRCCSHSHYKIMTFQKHHSVSLSKSEQLFVYK